MAFESDRTLLDLSVIVYLKFWRRRRDDPESIIPSPVSMKVQFLGFLHAHVRKILMMN